MAWSVARMRQELDKAEAKARVLDRIVQMQGRYLLASDFGQAVEQVLHEEKLIDTPQGILLKAEVFAQNFPAPPDNLNLG